MSPVIKITEFLAFYLPVFRTLLIVVVLAALMAYLFRARFANRRWLTVCMRMAGAVLTLPLIVTFFLMLSMVGASRPRIFVSPDSQHVAEYTYDAGILGRDFTTVTVRKKWSVRPEEVYSYDGPSNWADTEVRWLNSDRLIIRYPHVQDRPQQCKTVAAGILVQCEMTSEK